MLQKVDVSELIPGETYRIVYNKSMTEWDAGVFKYINHGGATFSETCYNNKKSVFYIGWASYYSNTEYYRIVSKEEEKEVYRKAFEEKAFKEIIRHYIDENYD
jgi:hypothetical protein